MRSCASASTPICLRWTGRPAPPTGRLWGRRRPPSSRQSSRTRDSFPPAGRRRSTGWSSLLRTGLRGWWERSQRTSWREDVGEAFLRHLVSLGLVQLPDGSDPYEAYERAVDRDRASGYAYAAQLQAGLEVRRVEAEARRFAAAWVPPRLVGDVTRLRELSDSAGLLPMVVSASALPIVVAAAPLAGFAIDGCRGIEVIVRDGRFTTEVLQPIAYAP